MIYNNYIRKLLFHILIIIKNDKNNFITYIKYFKKNITKQIENITNF